MTADSQETLECTERAYLPRCLVLLATYNGIKWLDEQLRSIYDQVDVEVRVVANDDQSTDGTLSLLSRWGASRGLEKLPNTGKRLGSANKNFLRMICDVDIGAADYVALADQDDVWYADKLSRAIHHMKAWGGDACSSDIEAFWSDGRTRIVRKSYPLKKWDYLFSSPGPGCTFVFRRSTFLDLRSWVLENFDALSNLWVHDWTLYAFVRSSGRKWLIDDYVSMRYRQHSGNEIGANVGLTAFERRLARVQSGQYRNDVLSITRLVGAAPRVLLALERMNFRDKLWLLSRSHQFRRSFKEVVIMLFLIFIMK